MSNDKDIIDKLLGYPEIDVCADAADEIVGLRSACARLRTEKEKLRAELATALKALNDMAAISVPIAERDELRAELAAEREQHMITRRRAAEIDLRSIETEERMDKLREALERARPYINHQNGNTAWDLLAAIDAALKETKGGDSD
jgi:chromosome segregation ATPase